MKRLYLAHTIKGLEFISKSELINKLPEIKIISIEPKKILFELPEQLSDSSLFRTFDDLSYFVDKFEFKMEWEILDFIDKLDLQPFRKDIADFRNLDNSFSVTVSSFKNRLVDKENLQVQIASLISKKYKWQYTPLVHENLDIRIQIEANTVLILIKVFPKSLFFRDYRIASQKGALRPSIAAAMLYYLTRGKGGFKVVDNFCGSGAFLCEALLDGNEVFGGDVASESVAIAQANLKTISKNFNMKQLDAQKTPWHKNSFDIAISNLPWDKQISVDHFAQLYSKAILEYGRILKPEGAIALIGAKGDLMKKYVKQIFPNRAESSVEVFKIGYLGQTPEIVVSSMYN